MNKVLSPIHSAVIILLLGFGLQPRLGKPALLLITPLQHPCDRVLLTVIPSMKIGHLSGDPVPLEALKGCSLLPLCFSSKISKTVTSMAVADQGSGGL